MREALERADDLPDQQPGDSDGQHHRQGGDAEETDLRFPQPRRVTEFRLSGADRIDNWPAKTNLGRARNLEQASSDRALAAIDPDSVVDITSSMNEAGTLTWQAPAGRWTILRIGYTPTGRMQNAASDAGLGLEIDKFSSDAMEFHFNKYFGALFDAFRPLADKKLVGALIDSYEVGMQNWTPAFPQEIRAPARL